MRNRGPRVPEEVEARSGHVYVISNVGSFGEQVYKIGMTRRLDPMDRVKELGDASVPFPFDVRIWPWPLRGLPTVYAAPARRYGLRSTDALPLSASKGTDVCSCETTHAPSVLRKQTVERTHMSTSRPLVIVPLTR